MIIFTKACWSIISPPSAFRRQFTRHLAEATRQHPFPLFPCKKAKVRFSEQICIYMCDTVHPIHVGSHHGVMTIFLTLERERA